MSVVQKFLLGAASLLLMVSLITLGVQMFEKGKKVADIMSSEQDNIAVALEEQGITKYDGYQKCDNAHFLLSIFQYQAL